MNTLQEMGSTIRQLRESKGMSQTDLALLVGYKDKTSIAKIEAGKVDLPQSKIKAFASALNTTPSYLFSGKMQNITASPGAVRIPVLGRVVAGIPISMIPEVLDWEEIPEKLASTGEFFALQIKGDSMEPRMREGDVVIVRQQPDADSGDVVIAAVNGDEATCKRLMKYESGIALISNNPNYTPLQFNNAEIQEKPVTILGKVVELRGKF